MNVLKTNISTNYDTHSSRITHSFALVFVLQCDFMSVSTRLEAFVPTFSFEKALTLKPITFHFPSPSEEICGEAHLYHGMSKY